MISDNTQRLQIPEGEVRELSSPDGLLWERAVSKFAARLEQAYVTRDNGIKSLKAYGGSPVKHKADKLWGRYVPCEYIGLSDGNAIATGVDALETDRIIVDANINTTQPARDNFMVDAGQSWIDFINSGQLYIRFGSTSSVYKNIASDEWGKRNTYELYKGHFDINGDTKLTPEYSLISGKWTINRIRESTISNVTNGLYYRVTIKNDITGEIRFDAIPVKDVVANVYGLWDRVEGKFYGNAGTGTITGGDLIQPIAYAESTGTQYIDTELINTNIQKITFEYELSNDVVANDIAFYGVAGVNDGFAPASFVTDTNNVRALWSTKMCIVNVNDLKGHHTIIQETNPDALYIDGNSRTLEDDTNSRTGSFTLLASIFNSSVIYGKMKLFHCDIKTADAQQRNYIPVRIGTSVELLDLISWTFATRTGTFTAGADIPYTQLCPDIIKVNTGDIRYGVGKNLFNNYEANIEAGKTYTISAILTRGGRKHIYTYDASGEQIRDLVSWPSSIEGYQTTTFTANVGEVKCKYTVSLDQVSELQLEEGSTATPYEPYHFGIHTDGSHKLTVSGVNLFDKSNAEVLTGYITNVGVGYATYVHNGTSERIILFKCKPSTTYTISKVSTDRLRIAEFPSKPTISSSAVTGSKLLYTDGDKTVATVTTDDNGEWLAIQVSNFALGGSQPTLQDVLNSLQIEEGSTATPYQPYITPISRDIPMLLSADSNLDVQRGSKTATWGIKVLDGTESWAYLASVPRFTIELVGSRKADNQTAPLCSHYVGYKTGGSISASQGCGIFASGGTYGTLLIKDINYTTVKDFKAYLASEYAKGTPVIILYPLANPVTEQVSIAPVTSARRTTYVADSDSELGKLNLELNFLGKFGIPANDENDV